MKVAIVGMGFTGISVLREYTKAKKNNPSIEITVFGDRKSFGRGLPYQKDNDNLLMNVPAEFTSILPDKRDDFVDWLKESQGKVEPRYKYYPRNLFGTYLEERMNEWLDESGAKIIKEKGEKLDLLENNQFRLQTKNGSNDFDVVHLCIGNFPYKDPYGLNDHPNFIINPFPVNEKLAKLPKNAKVGVIGTGLTSIDLFRYFHNDYPKTQLSFFSRSGQFKSISKKKIRVEFKYFTKENIKKEQKKSQGFIALDTYIDWFKKEITHQNLSLDKDWFQQDFGSKENIKEGLADSKDLAVVQALLIDMNPMLTELWTSLSEKDKQEYLDKYHGIWGKLRSTFPAESGEKLLKAWEGGEITIHKKLIDIIQKEDSFELLLKDTDSKKVDYLINASGTETTVSYDMKQMPLLSHLIDHRILQKEAFGGVQVTTPDLSAITQKYGVLKNLKVHGQLISGIQFGNNSVDVLSESARDAVEDVLENKANLKS